MADAVTNTAEQLIDAFLRDFGPLLQGKTTVMGDGANPELRRVVHVMLPDGAVYTYAVDRACFFLGALSTYQNHQVMVTSDGSGQTQVLSGAIFKTVPALLSSHLSTSGLTPYQKIRLQPNDKLYLNVNTGPDVVALVFDDNIQIE